MQSVSSLDTHGWSDNVSRSCPMRWYLDFLLPYWEDYMHRPVMVFEHSGTGYVIERVGPSAISVLGIYNPAEQFEEQFGFAYTEIPDVGSVQCAVIKKLETEAQEKGYKWRSEDSLDHLRFTLWELYTDIERQFE